MIYKYKAYQKIEKEFTLKKTSLHKTQKLRVHRFPLKKANFVK